MKNMSSFNKPKLISDENIPVGLTELLIKEGFDVKKIPFGSTDKILSKIAKAESRVILTFDKHFIDKNLFPPKEHPGIIFIDIHPPIIDAILSSLLKLFNEISHSEFSGKLFILSLFGFRIK